MRMKKCFYMGLSNPFCDFEVSISIGFVDCRYRVSIPYDTDVRFGCESETLSEDG